MRVDLHNHTTLCNHATGTIEQFLKRAIELKIDVYGISCHAPMNFDTKYRMCLDDKKDYEKCHNLLMSSFKVAGNNHSLAFDCNSNLAITSYKLGNLELAKEFVAEAKLLRPSNSVILFDEGFFSIVENKPEILAKKYNQLRLRFSSFKDSNILDIIEFISIEKLIFKDKPNFNLFEFAEGYLSIQYSDKKLGKEILENFVEYYPNAVNYNKNLYNLALLSLRSNNKKTKYSTYKKVS